MKKFQLASAALVLTLACSPLVLAQDTQTNGTQTNEQARQDAEHQSRKDRDASKAQAKADKAANKLQKSDKAKKAAKEQDQANQKASEAGDPSK